MIRTAPCCRKLPESHHKCSSSPSSGDAVDLTNTSLEKWKQPCEIWAIRHSQLRISSRLQAASRQHLRTGASRAASGPAQGK